MNIVPISRADAPQIARYVNIKDRTVRGESMFIAEGELVTHRLAQSRYEIRSVFVDDNHLPVWEAIAQATARQNVPVYAAPTPLLRSIVGYDFHLGIMAEGIRREESDFNLLLNDSFRRLVCLPACVKPDNLGSVFRSSAALGVDGILLGMESCDPLGRRTLRTSMGATLKMPWVRRDDIFQPLAELKQAGYKLVGTVLRSGAQNLNQFTWPDKTVLLLGNEYSGLSEDAISACDYLITIPMSAGVDSLNLGVSAGVFLYAMRQEAK